MGLVGLRRVVLQAIWDKSPSSDEFLSVGAYICKSEHPYHTVTNQLAACHQVQSYSEAEKRTVIELWKAWIPFYQTPVTSGRWGREAWGIFWLCQSTHPFQRIARMPADPSKPRFVAVYGEYAWQAAGGDPKGWKHYLLLVYMCPFDVILKKKKSKKIFFSIYKLGFLVTSTKFFCIP
jgi:hypothetical protein